MDRTDTLNLRNRKLWIGREYHLTRETVHYLQKTLKSSTQVELVLVGTERES